MSSKKIVILGSAHPLRGGLSAFNERLAYQLQEEGHEVQIYTFSLQYPNFLFPGTSQYSDEPAPKDLKIKITVNSINPFNWIKIGRELKKLRPDIVIVKFWLPFMGPCFGTILRILKGNRHTRVISVLDNVIPHEKRPGDLPFTQYFLKSVDACIAMSRSVQADLKSLRADLPCAFIPHPLYDHFGAIASKDIARQKLGIAVDEKVVLFFGFIRKYKGLDILMEAMSDERIKQAGIRLVVAGEFYEDATIYKDLIQKYGIASSCIMHTDFIPNSEVATYFNASDVVVQPYRTATQSGISQMAYHFEKPMIVTNVGGLPEIVPDGKVGFVTEVSAAAIATAIVQFFSDDMAQRLVAGVQAEKKKYEWHHMSTAILNA
jgi:glycosyltransferase involved in cell wall biosynthesis